MRADQGFAYYSRRAVLSALLALSSLFIGVNALAQDLTIAAASSLRPGLDHVVEAFQRAAPGREISVIYGSSGRLSAQILNGAPFDVFMSADMEYPQRLHAADARSSEPVIYAIGRIVLWSAQRDVSMMALQELAANDIRRIAIAQPTVAPYGARAQQALQALDLWQKIQGRVVFGENVSQAAQMAQSGAADIAITALSLAVQPALAMHPHQLIDDHLHDPLEHGMLISARGRDKALAEEFLRFMQSETALEILEREGFMRPEHQ